MAASHPRWLTCKSNIAVLGMLAMCQPCYLTLLSRPSEYVGPILTGQSWCDPRPDFRRLLPSIDFLWPTWLQDTDFALVLTTTVAPAFRVLKMTIPLNEISGQAAITAYMYKRGE